MRTRELAGSLALLCVALGLSLVIGEIVVRVLFPEYVAARSTRSFWHHDPLLGWKHRPGESGSMIFFDKFGRMDSVELTINAAGFRDQERSVSVPAGKTRVAALGDSFVFGYGVPASAIFTHVMEQSREELEVLNFGVSGYSTDQELLLLERVVLGYRPQAVVLPLIANDFPANREARGHGYPKPRFVVKGDELVLTGVPVPSVLEGPSLQNLDRFLRHRSALYHFLSYRLRARELGGALYRRWLDTRGEPEPAHDPAAPERDPATAPREGAHPYALTIRLIERFVEVSRGAGATVLLVGAPDELPLRDAAPRQKARALDRCAELAGCIPVDLYPEFNAHPGDKADLFLADRHHWSPAGHAVVAASLLRVLAASQPSAGRMGAGAGRAGRVPHTHRNQKPS